MLALILSVLLSQPLLAKNRQLPKQEFSVPDCQGEDIPIALATELALEHYHLRGIWAGVFSIDKVIEKRLDRTETGMVLHLHYHFLPIPGNRFQRTDQGFDQRTFYFQCEVGWQVKQMGPYLSAQFP